LGPTGVHQRLLAQEAFHSFSSPKKAKVPKQLRLRCLGAVSSSNKALQENKNFLTNHNSRRMGADFQTELLNFAASVVTPGQQHPWTFKIMNFALIGLFFTLVLVIVSGSGNIHHVIMLGMTVVLFGLIHWFLQALGKPQKGIFFSEMFFYEPLFLKDAEKARQKTEEEKKKE
jgi:hypothetical protein